MWYWSSATSKNGGCRFPGQRGVWIFGKRQRANKDAATAFPPSSAGKWLWDILWSQWRPRAGPWRVLALPFSFPLLLKRRCWVSTSDFLPLPPRTVPAASQGPRRRLKRAGDLNRETEQKTCHSELFVPGELNPLRAPTDPQFQPLWVATRPSPLHPSCNSSSLCWGNRGSPYTLMESRYTL